MSRTRRRTLALLALLPAWAAAAGPAALPAAPAAAPLRIAVAPHTSARVIVEMYQPLRAHLEHALGQRVEVITAPDFTAFARRAMAQDYDLAITTGHQARLLQTDAGYRPLLTYKADFRALAVVAGKSPHHSARDLAGSTVIGLSPASLVTIWGQHWLHRNAVPDATMRYVSASDSVGHLVLKGEGSAGFMSLANFQGLPPALREQLRVLDESTSMSGRVYVLNARHAARQEAVSAALWAFAGTPEGRAYFDRYKLGGYRALEPRELFAMEPYANEVRLALKAPPAK